MKSLIEERDRLRRAADERARHDVRGELRSALAQLCPGEAVWLYGSITCPGRFRDWSDIDLALEREPRSMSLLTLMSRLSEATGRSIDLSLMSETRLADKIQREGERWIG